MIPKQTLVSFPEFCNSGTKTAPEAAKYSAGYQPADVLPAEHLNYFENKSSAGISALNDGVDSMEEELVTLVEAAGATPSASTNNQVLNAVNYLISAITGTLTNLATTAKNNLVAAINEVKNGLTSHTGNTSNPHSVTKAQVGLGNVTNVSTDNALNKTSTNNIQNNVVSSNIATVLNTQGQTIAKTVSITGATLYDGLTIKICFQNGHSGASFTVKLNNNAALPVFVNKKGTATLMASHSINSTSWFIQKYTTLELIYDSSLDDGDGGWLVLGNPEVLTGETTNGNYRIKADGLIEQFNTTSSNTDGVNTITFPVAMVTTNYAISVIRRDGTSPSAAATYTFSQFIEATTTQLSFRCAGPERQNGYSWFVKGY